MTERIRILIADDHAVVRHGLRALITTEPDLELVGEASDGVEAVNLHARLNPDVTLMDMAMPRKTGLEAIIDIMRSNPQARILVLTSFAEDEQVFPAIKAGATGYMLKDTAPRELLQAIRDVHCGQVSLHPTIARKLVGELKRPADLPPAEDPLTEREVQVLALVARGLANQEIADKLFIGERTVRTHISNILGKLHLANRTQAALYAQREGLAHLEM
ncbi:Transcriptional regulatory protein LiaR [Gammaproteobacteria bacterium]|nr:Transcriptional regulatory protein LiaR [Gammaproteobacteria bacterium]